MKPGELRRFKDIHRRYPGASFLVLEVTDLEPGYSTQETAAVILIDGRREFGWHGELLEASSEPVDAAR